MGSEMCIRDRNEKIADGRRGPGVSKQTVIAQIVARYIKARDRLAIPVVLAAEIVDEGIPADRREGPGQSDVCGLTEGTGDVAGGPDCLELGLVRYEVGICRSTGTPGESRAGPGTGVDRRTGSLGSRTDYGEGGDGRGKDKPAAK